ncbi:uncharacterized protein [Watersipora subatra]|uniref:uncharacterized protein n=1 Tax=Watersipora subatra TaxID=2589382 RepID=UPI00355C6141
MQHGVSMTFMRWLVILVLVFGTCWMLKAVLPMTSNLGPMKHNVMNEEMKQKVSEKLTLVLNSLENTGVASPLGAVPVPIQAVISHIKNMPISILTDKAEKKVSKTEVKPDVCPEPYAYDQLDGDYPYFYKGFNMENCTGVPMFSSLLTLTYNCVGYSQENLLRVPQLLASVQKFYPGIKVLVALPHNSSITVPSSDHTTLVTFNSSKAEADVWRQLIAKVTSKYVYIGREAVHFTQFDRLERLVREINNLDVHVVASAVRGYHSGKWTKGCEQSRLHNYTLEYKQGYEMSKEECIVCHHVHGPFVTKTEVFKEFPFPSSVSAISGFAIWFHSMVEQKRGLVTCPDSMSFVTDESREASSKQAWLGLAEALQVETVRLDDGSVMYFDCEEAKTSCSLSGGVGIAASQCCRRQHVESIKTISTLCEKSGLACWLTDETLLGALKFNGEPPWGGNASMALASSDFQAFGKLKEQLTTKGYTLTTHSSDKYYTIGKEGWSMKLSSAPEDDKEDVFTVISYADTRIRVPVNPGLAVESMSGGNPYRHLVGGNDWKDNPFPVCSKPGFHGCLQRIPSDGNLF